MQIYNSCIDQLFTQIDSATSNGQSAEICHLVNLFTLNVILRCAFSVDERVQELGDKIPYVRTVRDLGRSITERLFKPHWLVDGIYYRTSHGREFQRLCKFSHDYASKVIQKRKSRLQAEEKSNGKR